MLLLVLCLLAILPGTASASDPSSPPEARITATVRNDLSEISGTFELPVQNRTREPIHQVALLLFPRTFRTKPAALNDISYSWLYPWAFSKGDMSISDLEVCSPGLNTCHALPVPDAPDVVLSLSLPGPLEPGETLKVRGHFVTTVPHRFGGFGHFRSELALHGAFFPLVLEALASPDYLEGALPAPLQRAALEAGFPSSVGLPRRTFLISIRAPSPSVAKVEGEGCEPSCRIEALAPSITVGHGHRTLVLSLPAAPPLEIDLLQSTTAQERARLVTVLSESLEMLTGSFPDLVDPQGPPIHLIQVPMRDVLTLPTDRTLFVSDRLFKVMKRFRIFHDRELRWRLYQLLLEERLSRLEGDDANWLASGLGFALADQLKPNGERVHDLEGLLHRVKIIPLVDRVLYNPTFPLGETYADSVSRPDRFEQWLHTGLGLRPPGPLVIRHLEHLLGKEAMESLVRNYLLELERGTSFRTLVDRAAGREGVISPDWLGPRGEGNYRLSRYDVSRGERGYLTTVTLEREGNLPAEPVLVRVETRARGREDTTEAREGGAEAVFEPLGEETLVIQTESRPTRAVLDPEMTLLESGRSDNQRPQQFNWLLWEFGLWVNAGLGDATSESDVATSIWLDMRYKETAEEHHVFDVTGYRLEESVGASMGYYRYFGRARTVYRWNQELHLLLGYRQMREAYEIDSLAPEAVHLADLERAMTLRGGYSYDNRLFPYYPIRGTAFDVFFQLGMGFDSASRGAPFGGITLHLRRLFPFSEVHGLAARARLDTLLFGSSVPIVDAYALGGAGEHRGIAPRELIGESKVLLSLEDRHPLFLNLDIDLGGLRVRELRGVAFADVGAVAGQRLAGMSAEDFRLSIGYGLRCVWDLFGLSPLLLSLDAAVPWQRARGEEWPDFRGTRFVFGFYQAF